VELVAARVCVGEWIRRKNARSLYIGRRQATAAGRVATPLLCWQRVGDGRLAGEASPLTRRRLPKRRSDASRWRA
jgi:hypothetical protein